MAKAIVIGAGFGGIAAALRLRAKGYEVTLIDKQDKLGGRAYVWKRNGFTFDAGPTVITAPFLFDELFELFGKNREDYVKFVPLYPWYRVQFADKTFFDYGGTLEQTLENIRKFEPRDCDGYLKFLEHSQRIFDIGFVKLGDAKFDTFMSMIRCAPDLLKLGNWRSVYQMASKYIKSEKLRRVFSFQPLLVGGNPFNTTSIYSLIHFLEREWGVHFAMGGTGAIVDALERLMREEGIEIRLGEEVTRIRSTGFQPVLTPNHKNGLKTHATVAGVTLPNGELLEAEVIAANAEPPWVYANLVDKKLRRGVAARRIDSTVKPLKYSMGLFVLYFGTTKKYPDIKHHTIILGEKYKGLLTDMFDSKCLEWKDLSIYLHRPTATDESMAPPGCDCWYVLVPVPNLQGGQDWQEIGPKYRDAVIDYLERTALPGLRECITEDFYVTPEHFRDNLNSMHGAGFSIQPTFDQSAWFRFHNKAPGIEGLYFVGAGTHPGAGMPGVLCSAKVLDRYLPPLKPETRNQKSESMTNPE
ncbi:MAG TPA: phytoene desaturase family protein [Tepidisphaeraceae bacterium]|nr:phytoene desaturase family protein [Tepidisphaeraceae bacterium]